MKIKPSRVHSTFTGIPAPFLPVLMRAPQAFKTSCANGSLDETWNLGLYMDVQSGSSHLRIGSMMKDNQARPAAVRSQVPAWFERKFDFAFPEEQYPILCIRLWGAPARLEEMLREVSREVLLSKPEGKWSAKEHAGHLLDLEPLWMARVDDFLTDADTLTVADLSNRRTHEANHNSRELTEILVQFRTARLHLLDYVGKFQPAIFARSKLHPRLKQPMRFVDHLYFVAEHDDHHMARIWEMIGPGFKKGA